jgi:hypothetical protein
MAFPTETIAKAREIADLYRLRRNSQLAQARMLYHDKFIELDYGFEDAIKSGRCGHFLHQVKKDAECFSFAGIKYVIAKELGLRPKIYWAVDMKDVKEGQNPDEKLTADHSFISVVIKGDEWVLDANYNRFGKVTKKNGKMIIENLNNDAIGSREIVTRQYTSLTDMSEKEYVAKMRKNQSPEGGKAVLASAQVLDTADRRVALQYFPDSRRLVSFLVATTLPFILEVLPCKKQVFELDAPLEDDGTWNIEEGTVNCFFAKNDGWTREQHELVHSRMSWSYSLVEQYLGHFETAARHFGRKEPLYKRRIRKLDEYFGEIGFSKIGAVTKDNGVDPAAHNRLLDELVESFPIGKEPPEVIDALHQKAAYFAAQFALSDRDTDAFVYPEKERVAVFDELWAETHNGFQERMDLFEEKLLAKAGFRKGLRKLEERLRTMLNEDDSDKRFNDYLHSRKKEPYLFDWSMDFACFQKEHPLGSVTATDEDILLLYKNRAHLRMIYLTLFFRSMKVNKFRHGLKRILAK